MSTPASRPTSYRILVIDDNPKIHEDIRKVLVPKERVDRDGLEAGFLGDDSTPAKATVSKFEIESAYQGTEGVEKIRQAISVGRPYALAIVDMRMPPGIDGRETIKQLSLIDDKIQVLLCTAYSDYTWQDLAETTGPTARVVILRKPFDCIEVQQLAHALTEKWWLEGETRRQMAELRSLVAERTEELTESHAVFQMMVEEAVRHTKV